MNNLSREFLAWPQPSLFHSMLSKQRSVELSPLTSEQFSFLSAHVGTCCLRQMGRPVPSDPTPGGLFISCLGSGSPGQYPHPNVFLSLHLHYVLLYCSYALLCWRHFCFPLCTQCWLLTVEGKPWRTALWRLNQYPWHSVHFHPCPRPTDFSQELGFLCWTSTEAFPICFRNCIAQAWKLRNISLPYQPNETVRITVPSNHAGHEAMLQLGDFPTFLSCQWSK